MPATPFLFSLARAGGRFSLLRGKMEPESECRCGGESWKRRPNVVAAGKDGTGGRMSLRRRKMEPEAECRCGGERWNRRANVVAAEKDGTGGRMSLRRGQAATPAAFYLGLCRLRGILSLPAAHDYAAGGPFFCAATMALHRFPSLALKSRIDARWSA